MCPDGCRLPHLALHPVLPPPPQLSLPHSPTFRLLWFKRRLPRYATKFIEMCVVLCADHGPCVSGQ